MSDQHPNAQRVLTGMRAFNANDIDSLRAIYREDMVYHVAGRGPLAGDYHGLEEYAAVVRRVREESCGTMRFDTEVILADERTVMMLARSSGERQGQTLNSESVYVFRFDEDGRCYEARTIPVDQYAYDAFWS